MQPDKGFCHSSTQLGIHSKTSSCPIKRGTQFAQLQIYCVTLPETNKELQCIFQPGKEKCFAQWSQVNSSHKNTPLTTLTTGHSLATFAPMLVNKSGVNFCLQLRSSKCRAAACTAMQQSIKTKALVDLCITTSCLS